jgi:hypothetical protein
MTRAPLSLLALLSFAAPSAAQCFEQQLLASDAADVDLFGWSIDLHGDLLVLGSLRGDDACLSDPECNSGAAYVFRRSGGVWTEETKLVHSDGAIGDELGQDVAVYGDRVVAGAHMKGAGAAYVWSKASGSWVQEQKLTGSGTQTMFHFGHSVSIDGEVIVVGTMRDDHQGAETGSAYVFTLENGVWTERDYLTASDAGAGDRYGRSSDIQGDYIAIGSHRHDGVGGNSGSAYVYERDDNGTPGDPSDDSWPEAAALVASDTAPGIQFGRCVDLSGTLLVVGADEGLNSSGVNTGAAYLFFRSGGVWVQAQKLTPSDGQAGDAFGTGVAIDGNYILVGSKGSDAGAAETGATYVFTRTNSGFFETAKLLGNDTVTGDQVGHENGVHVIGDTAVITSRFSDTAANIGGSAYTFDLNDCLGANYCDITPNSAGSGAEIRVAGSHSVLANDFTLITTGAIPNKVGLYFYGPSQVNIPLGNGRLCILPVVRLNPPIITDGSGIATRAVDFTVFPAGSGPNQITTGSTWNFQYWFRDPPGGGAEFNLSNAVQVTFIP